MFSPAQRQLIGIAAVLAACAMGVLAATQLRAVPQARLAPGRPAFQPAVAMHYTRVLSMDYPYRITGTQSSRRAAAYIARQLRGMGYLVELERFPIWFYGKRIVGEDVIARSPSASRNLPYIAVLAHYDSPRTSPNAAEDDASGVGTMLELARIARGRIARPVFIATDAEETGMLGARAAASYLHARGHGAAISIDYIASGRIRGLELDASGQYGGYAPLWLREMARAAQAQQSALVQYPSGLAEWIDRAVNRSFQDQGPLLRAGIPAVNLGTRPEDRAAAMKRYHTPQDVYANFTRSAFAIVGRSAERMMLTLQRKEYDRDLDGFLVTPGHYIAASALWLIQLIALAPLLAAMAFAIRNLGPRLPVLAGRLIPLALPPVLAYVLAVQSAQHNVMLPRFELYPPPPKDPLLYRPPAIVLAALIAVAGLGYAVVRRWAAPFEKSVLFFWTVVLGLAAFAIQPYGMWIYLGGFAYAALLFVERPGRVPLAVNLVLCALSALPFAAVLTLYASEMQLGPFVVWYLVLQSAYGVWSSWIVGIALFAILVWTQFVRLALVQARSSEIPAANPLRQAEEAASVLRGGLRDRFLR